MKKYTLHALLLSIFLSTAISPALVFASQEIKPFCVDYSLSNVVLEMVSELDTAFAGSTLLIRGVATNRGDFAITEGNLLVKVYNSDRMVDRFIVPLNVYLEAGGYHAFSFPWTSSTSLVSGAYDITASFVSSGKFVFGNGALSDEEGFGSAHVKIIGKATKEIYFDKTKMQVSGDTVSEKNFTLEIPLVSTFSTATEVAVKWSIYAGSGIDETSLIDSYVSVINVPAQGIKKVSYVVKDDSVSEYYAVVEAKYGDTKSIALIPFSRFGRDSSVLRFAGIKKTGSQSSVFGCLSSTLGSGAKKVAITASNAKGKLFTTSFDVGKTLNVGFTENVDMRRSQGNITLSTVVVDSSGHELDRARSVYRCVDLGLCMTSTMNTSFIFGTSKDMYALVTIASLLLLIYIIRRVKINN